MESIYNTIIFLHIEKTAGSSISNLIANANNASDILRINSTPQLIKTISKQPKKSYSAILGHFFYGIHLFGLSYHPYAYYTMLREPVDRFISQYYYIKRAPLHHLHNLINDNNLTLAQFASINQHTNQQIIRLGYHIFRYGDRFDIKQSGNNILMMAKHTLAHLVKHFGIYEYFDESMHKLSKLIGMTIKDTPNENVTHNRPRVEDLETSTLNTIRKSNALDIELYEYAKRVFETRSTAF